MKLNYKVTLVLVLLFLLEIISGCGVSQEKKIIYSDNTKIAQEGDSFSYMTRKDIEESNDKINIKYSGFYGTDTIWVIESSEDSEITFKYNSTVNSGDFKAVLVNSKKEIENIFIGNQQGNKTIKLTKGKFMFKIVGSNAKGNIIISINKNQNVSIIKSNK